MTVLIISQNGDIHAVAVATLAQNLGLPTLLWTMPSVAGEACATVSIDGRNNVLRISGQAVSIQSIRTVWNRRRIGCNVPDYVHPDDRDFVFRENARFWRALWSPITDRAMWIADGPVADRAEDKIRQLLVAAEVGLHIPLTLFGNDVDETRNFIANNVAAGFETIYKTFTPVSWRSEDNGLRIKHTSIVTTDHLDPAVFGLTPGIFQRRVAKQFEVRANFFGDQVHSVRINSQHSEVTRLDWRASITSSGMLSEWKLPSGVVELVRKLLNRLDLHMACVDFIVDDSGKYWFVELNQQGQFLWIEEELPSMRMLSRFAEFLYGLPAEHVDVPLADIITSLEYDNNYRAFQARGFLHV